jgi:LysM repeat protein
MNNQSPLIPQGSNLEQKIKGRARVKIAVFVVLAIHGVGLLALLMQGCRKPDDSAAAQSAEATNNLAPSFASTDTNIVPNIDNSTAINPSAPGSAQSNTGSLPPLSLAPNNNPNSTGPSTLAPLPGPGSDYTVLKGDSLAAIAKNHHVTLKALTEANPGIEAARLKIGSKLHIPSPSVAGSTAGIAAAPSTVSDSAPVTQKDSTLYTVKSGDNLIKIANQHKVSVKAIRAVNKLTSDNIKVGQKLKMPIRSVIARQVVTHLLPYSRQPRSLLVLLSQTPVADR